MQPSESISTEPPIVLSAEDAEARQARQVSFALGGGTAAAGLFAIQLLHRTFSIAADGQPAFGTTLGAMLLNVLPIICGLAFVVGGIAMLRGARWPALIVVAGAIGMLGLHLRFFGSSIWRIVTEAHIASVWRTMDHLSTLRGTVFPLFAIVYFLWPPATIERQQRRMVAALSISGGVLALSRLGDARFAKMGLYLFPTALRTGDFSKLDGLGFRTSVAVASFVLGLATIAAVIRLLLARVDALNCLRLTEWAALLLTSGLMIQSLQTDSRDGVARLFFSVLAQSQMIAFSALVILLYHAFAQPEESTPSEDS